MCACVIRVADSLAWMTVVKTDQICCFSLNCGGSCSLPGEDSSSDLSSDSPIWSEDESDAELDLNMPLSEQGVETVTHGSEIVRCICEVQEENDFMIQVNYHPLTLDQTSIL